jgi:hypothetical protein
MAEIDHTPISISINGRMRGIWSVEVGLGARILIERHVGVRQAPILNDLGIVRGRGPPHTYSTSVISPTGIQSTHTLQVRMAETDSCKNFHDE